MSKSISQHKLISPLVEIDFSQLGTQNDVLTIVEHGFLGHLNIRGASTNKAFMQAAKSVLGVELPIKANIFVNSGDNTVLWLGPNEWLVLTPQGEASGLKLSLRAAFGEEFSSVNEISGGNTVLELSGAQARSLLIKGCPLDLHHSVFKTGQCAQSVLGKTSVTLWQLDDAPTYRLIVRRSFADYLGHWLLDAAREFAE